MNNEYHPGQRWISNTEADYGLGFIEKIEGRHMTVIFPAVDESRVYATDNAPLNRVKYPIGETIGIEDGETLTVTGHDEHNHCIVYIGVNEDNKEVRIHELELDSFARFSQPQDRLFAGQVDKSKHFELRVESLQHLHRQHQSPAFGLLGPRVQILPHQFYIAHQVSQRHAPRVLLADEVGLGKTIEAGLILHQQVLTERVKRALIVVPETLVHQWLVEMLRRFNLHFTILDEERCFAIEEEGNGTDDINNPSQHQQSNPFESAQLVLCSLSFLTENPVRHQQAVDAGWDLMIVDEAHHLGWSENHVSNEYVCIESLAKHIPGLLLLTATPEQLGIESHFARLKLLDPDRFFDLKQFKKEEASYQPINELVQWLQADAEGWQDEEKLNQLESYLGKTEVDEFIENAALDANEINPADSIIQSLLDRHGTGRVLFRNTRDTVKGFPQRKVHTYSLALPKVYQIADAPLEDQLHPERLLLQDANQDEWINADPRVEWLSQWLEKHPNDKVLLICAHAETALTLEAHLRLKTTATPSVFHEGLSILERDRAAAYFADDEMGAQILICSEIGSEGRNFQFAHHLILFDLPLNPDLLEQRIGRLDRIGQTQTINIHIPYFEDGAQQRLMRWYHEGLNAFEHVCSVGHSIFEIFENELHRELLHSPQLQEQQQSDTFDDFIARSKALTEETLHHMQQGRDRLLELNSCDVNHAQEVINNVNDISNTLTLSAYMDAVFDQHGIDNQPHSSESFIIKPTDHMMNAHFPSLPEDGMTATYNRATALSREDVQFLTWEHPMVSGSMDMIINSEFGNATFCALELGSQQVPAGTLILEAIFKVHCPAPNYLQVPRYISDGIIRMVIDTNGNDLSEILNHELLNAEAQRVNKRTLLELIQHARPHIQQLVENVQKQIKPQQVKLIDEAQTKMLAEAKDDQQRLKALAKVNPNIRQDEIEQLEDNATELLSYLKMAQLKLDAIRVSLVTG